MGDRGSHGGRSRHPARMALLLAMLAVPGANAATQRDERFTPAPAPSVALPRLTPSGGVVANGPTPGVALQPAPVVAPALSPIRVPGAPPPPPKFRTSPPPPTAAKSANVAPPPLPLPLPLPIPPPTTEPLPAATAAPQPAPPALEPAPAADKPAVMLQQQRPAVVTIVTTADVNLRAAARGDARVVDEVERGQRFDIVGPAPDGWVHVGRNGKALGYIAAAFTAEAKAAAAKEAPLGRYAKASRADNGCALPDDMPAAKRRTPLPVGSTAHVRADANLRVAPACDAKVADVLDSGGRVTVLGQHGSWYRVGRNGHSLGYVGAALLSPAKER